MQRSLCKRVDLSSINIFAVTSKASWNLFYGKYANSRITHMGRATQLRGKIMNGQALLPRSQPHVQPWWMFLPRDWSVLDVNWGTPNPVPRQQISILKTKPLHNLVDSNWQGQEKCKGMRTCELMNTLTYMHSHHCNSSANVLKRAASCQRGNTLPGDCRENYSLHESSGWWRGVPMHQCFQGSASQLRCV